MHIDVWLLALKGAQPLRQPRSPDRFQCSDGQAIADMCGWLNLSLNTITLLALSLVVGILVDDAIVEIENIIPHMRQTGKGAMAATQEAADEIGLAVVATTGTLVAVFMPVAFMPGVAGQIFLSFGVAVSVSVVFSLIVARMLTPLMEAYRSRWFPAIPIP